MPRKARHTDLQRNIIDFCRVLREREMLVTPSEVIDAIKTADAVDLSDRLEFKKFCGRCRKHTPHKEVK